MASNPPHNTRRPDLSEDNLAVYRVDPQGKKPFYEIYDGPPDSPRIKVRLFPDIAGTQLSIREALAVYKGEDVQISGRKKFNNEPYEAYVCLRRIKSGTYNPTGATQSKETEETHTIEMGLAYPKRIKKGDGAQSRELIGYRLWLGFSEPMVDFFASAGSKKQVQLKVKDCFSLYDGQILEIKNHRVKLMRLGESTYDGKPIRVARVSASVIKRQRGAEAVDEPEEEESQKV